MTREELVEFLKENLSINVEEKRAKYGDGKWCDVELILCGEVISSSTLPSASI